MTMPMHPDGSAAPVAWTVSRAELVEPGCAVLGLEGELDLACCEAVTELLRGLEAAAPARVVVDLRAVTFLDLSALRILVAAHHRATLDGRALVVVRPVPPGDCLFEMLAGDLPLDVVRRPPAPVDGRPAAASSPPPARRG